MKRFFLLSLSLLIPFINWAQCAMCRTQIKNNVSHGETELAAGLNLGILYLFFTPYVMLGVIGFLWFRYSKKNDKKIPFFRNTQR